MRRRIAQAAAVTALAVSLSLSASLPSRTQNAPEETKAKKPIAPYGMELVHEKIAALRQEANQTVKLAATEIPTVAEPTQPNTEPTQVDVEPTQPNAEVTDEATAEGTSDVQPEEMVAEETGETEETITFPYYGFSFRVLAGAQAESYYNPGENDHEGRVKSIRLQLSMQANLARECGISMDESLMIPGRFEVVSNGAIWNVTEIYPETLEAARCEATEGQINTEIKYCKAYGYHSWATPCLVHGVVHYSK